VIVDAATEEGVFELEVVASVIEVSALDELGGT
jgi:hypothetical protein